MVEKPLFRERDDVSLKRRIAWAKDEREKTNSVNSPHQLHQLLEGMAQVFSGAHSAHH